MTHANSSSSFTNDHHTEPLGPPLIGALLRHPWEAVNEHMLERLHANGFSDFDASYLIVFQYPGPQGQRPSELAARLHVSKQALNHLLGQLERRGYVERQPDDDDKRSKRIAVTARGIQAGTTMRDAVAELESTWAQQLGPKRFEQLRNLLHDLNRPS
jgi:DNA-binding MarR family transcriptional regulator